MSHEDEILDALARRDREKAGHTPGPWKVSQYSSGAEIMARVPLVDGTRGEYQLLLASVMSDRHHDPQGNANAALIAAAPDLLAALETLVADIEHKYRDRSGDVDHSGIDAALAAIAKAKAH
jgi:hypothetical protein